MVRAEKLSVASLRQDRGYLLLQVLPSAALVAVAAGGLIMRKPPTREASQRGRAVIQARADVFARSMAGTIAALEREGVRSSLAMAKLLNERGVASARFRRWSARTVINLRRRLKRLG